MTLNKYERVFSVSYTGKPLKLQTEQERDIGMLRWADKTYAAGKPIMTDSAYDKAREMFQRQYPDDPYFTQVGASNIAYKKVPHEIYLGSLKKLRPAEAMAFLEKQKHLDITWGAYLKLDGISLSLHYKKGKLFRALTRGTGKIGQDVTEWTKFIPAIPRTIDKDLHDVIIMGEAIITRPDFMPLRDLGYANARNAVAGVFRKKTFDEDHKALLKAISFYCWRVWYRPEQDMKWRMLSENKREQDKSMNVVMLSNLFERGEEATEDGLTQWIKHNTDTARELACDGIVMYPILQMDKKLLGELNTTLPDWGFAVKLPVADQNSLTGEIDHVLWEQSIRGIYVPVAVLKDALDFDGVKVTNISLHNLSYVKEYGAGEGSEVTVIRSGDVIPRVLTCTPSDNFALPETCDCGTKLESDDTNLYCPNPDCSGVVRHRFLHFIKCLDIDGISEESAIAMYDKVGLKDAKDVVKLCRGEDTSEIESVLGPSRTGKLVTGIKNWHPTEAGLSYASGLFNSRTVSLGVKRLEVLFNEGTNAEGIGPKIKTFFESVLPKYRVWEGEVGITPSKPVIVTGALTGKSFAFTGFRDKELEAKIKEHGGKVESVKKTTTALFGEKGSTKAAKAEKYGVEIVSPDDARAYIEGMLK